MIERQMTILRCAVIGVGYLGKFHAEKYASLDTAELVGVCDANLEHCQKIAAQFNTEAYTNYRDLLNKVDAVSIVVPTSLHHEVAKFFLDNNVHVLLEKPITTTVEEANELIAIADKNKCVFQIGHLERFNNAIKALENILDKPLFIESMRLAPFNLRGIDVDVVLDLMIHDIDIIHSLVKSPIKNIQANGTAVLSSHIDIANARIEFENGCVANVTASRVSAKQQRVLRLFQHDAYIALDLQEKVLSLHKKGKGEMFPGIPEIIREESVLDKGDAIMDEIIDFNSAINNGTEPQVTGRDGRDALATAIQITDIVHAQIAKLNHD